MRRDKKENVPMANNPQVPVRSSTATEAAFDAAAAIGQLEQIITSVPGFEPPDRKFWRTINRKSGYPNEYIEATADIVDASEELREAAHFSTPAARSGVKLSNDLQALIKEAENFTEGLRFTDAKLRASLADACDQVYVLAPGVARTDRSLAPHIAAMRHTSRRKGGRKKAATPSPAPSGPPTATAGEG
jgi:hypothetical protein